eukprot:TRINITY_DN3665_c0_g1_i1.p1 TRINITY_DN3665_c0_g1~~TRINITY_DN3665_c0_g1_i1.p1  ORF type:complete len:359 (+),score=62.38 TRINITY_DN3665_c0_g1_i1:25-1077(+)
MASAAAAAPSKYWTRGRIAGGVVALFVAYRIVKRLTELRRVKHSKDTVVPQSIQGQIGQSDSPLSHFFVNAQGLFIYTHSWEVPHPKGIIFIIHGLGEHCLRYQYLATKFNEAGYSVFAMDNQGHGQSGGDRMHVEKFIDFADDYWQFVQRVVARLAPKGQTDLPRFLLGHSLGGQIAIRLLLARDAAQDGYFRGVILSSPAIKPDPATASPQLQALVSMLASIVPRLEVSPLNPAFVSRDQSIVWNYKKDRLNLAKPMEAHFAYEVIKSFAFTLQTSNLSKFKTPVFVIHGTQDKMTTPQGSQQFFDGIQSEDKTIKLYEDYYHEMFNEPRNEREVVIKDVLTWVEARK